MEKIKVGIIFGGMSTENEVICSICWFYTLET